MRPDHAPSCPTTLVPLLALADLPRGRSRAVRLGALDLAVHHSEAGVFVTDDSCPHAGASLSAGSLQGRHIVCRAHGLRFALDQPPVPACQTSVGGAAPVATPCQAACTAKPALMQLATYAAQLVDGQVCIAVATGPRT